MSLTRERRDENSIARALGDRAPSRPSIAEPFADLTGNLAPLLGAGVEFTATRLRAPGPERLPVVGLAVSLAAHGALVAGLALFASANRPLDGVVEIPVEIVAESSAEAPAVPDPPAPVAPAPPAQAVESSAAVLDLAPPVDPPPPAAVAPAPPPQPVESSAAVLDPVAPVNPPPPPAAALAPAPPPQPVESPVAVLDPAAPVDPPPPAAVEPSPSSAEATPVPVEPAAPTFAPMIAEPSPAPAKAAPPPPPPTAEPRQALKPAPRSKPAPTLKLASSPARPAVGGAATPAAAKTDLGAYRASLYARIYGAVRYPESARERGVAGAAVVSFSVDATGRVTTAGLTQSSGDAALDAEAVASVQRASPVPPPPDGAPRAYVVPLRFHLR